MDELKQSNSGIPNLKTIRTKTGYPLSICIKIALLQAGLSTDECKDVLSELGNRYEFIRTGDHAPAETVMSFLDSIDQNSTLFNVLNDVLSRSVRKRILKKAELEARGYHYLFGFKCPDLLKTKLSEIIPGIMEIIESSYKNSDLLEAALTAGSELSPETLALHLAGWLCRTVSDLLLKLGSYLYNKSKEKKRTREPSPEPDTTDESCTESESESKKKSRCKKLKVERDEQKET